MFFGLFNRKNLKGNVSKDKVIWNYLTEYMKAKEDELNNLFFEKVEIPKRERIGNWTDNEYDIYVRDGTKVSYVGREFRDGNIYLKEKEYWLPTSSVNAVVPQECKASKPIYFSRRIKSLFLN